MSPSVAGAPASQDRTAAPPPVAVLAAAAVAQHLMSRRRPSTRWSRAAAAIVGTVSLALAGATGLSFLTRRTTVSPHRLDGPTTLVTTGPNRLSRNPIYLAMVGLLAAHAFWHRSWATVLPIPAFVGALTRWQILPEEAALTRLFPAEYQAYRASTPRWIGPRASIPR